MDGVNQARYIGYHVLQICNIVHICDSMVNARGYVAKLFAAYPLAMMIAR